MGPSDAPTVLDGCQVDRTWLDERSWVDVGRGWLDGHAALLEALTADVAWDRSRIFRYDHWVDEPRLGAMCRLDDPPHPVIRDAHRTLQHRYGVRLAAPSLALYQDGLHSVAFHRDRDLRWLDDTVIAIVVLGERRPFLLRPRANRYAHELPDRGATHDLAPGRGDLVAMGGGCQAGWEHSVPKRPGHRSPRVSLQWRWTSRSGRPEVGASYRAPRLYGQGRS